jgi:hypothetical protein
MRQRNKMQRKLLKYYDATYSGLHIKSALDKGTEVAGSVKAKCKRYAEKKKSSELKGKTK